MSDIHNQHIPACRWRGLLLLAFVPMVALGCTRNFYRTQADQEAAYTIRQLASLTERPLEYFNVYTDPRSRLFDPTNPDRPPIPPDDPAAHKLMHNVNYMPGYRKWYRNGTVPNVDLGRWQEFLPPADEDGAIPLDLGTAVELARMNSREYQQQLETFYLAALDVTFERFRFTAQWFGTNNTNYRTLGPAAVGGPLANWAINSDLQRQQLFGGGGQLIVELANSLTWNLIGPNTHSNTTLASFSLTQPFLRRAGRAFVMERLTLAERTLLYDVRQMEQYRRGFFTSIASGRSAGQGTQRLGGVFGTSGLGGFTGVGGGGFGQVGTAVAATGGLGTGAGGSGAGAAQANGFIGVLQDIMQIRNQEANVAGLRDSVAQLQAAYEAGRIDRFQVDLTRQSLYLNESQVLNAKAVMENLLDSLKVQMGLPPDVNFVLKDPFLDRFKLMDPGLIRAQNHVDNLIEKVRNPSGPIDTAQLDAYFAEIQKVHQEISAHLSVVDADFVKLNEMMPARRATLKRLQLRPEYDRGDVEPEAYSPALLDQRIETLQNDYKELRARLEKNWGLFDSVQQQALSTEAENSRQDFLDVLTGLSGQVLELTLVQARARLDSIELVPINIVPSQAMVVASAARPDWKNTRAGVIDTWRRIEFNASDLMTGMSVVFSGDIGTTNDNPIKFKGATGELNVGVQFDAPLTRLGERNNYRQSLIDYQQSRRRYMQYVDSVHQTLRQEIRQINLNQINFEQNRAAVGIAIEKVDIARLKLMQPPAPGETSAFSNTFARDLLQALNDLLQAQNDFMSVWVNYEVQRMSLDFDLGTMQLDERGMWIDPGPIDGRRLVDEYSQDCEPEELPFLRQATEDAERQAELLREGKTEQEQRDEELPPPDPHTTDSVLFDPGNEAPEEDEDPPLRLSEATEAPARSPAANRTVARFRLVAGEEPTAPAPVATGRRAVYEQE